MSNIQSPQIQTPLEPKSRTVCRLNMENEWGIARNAPGQYPECGWRSDDRVLTAVSLDLTQPHSASLYLQRCLGLRRIA